MAYLNEQDREKLLEELIKLPFIKAKNKLRRMDRQARLDVYRNMQRTNEWVTRYDLPNLGTTVTLIEKARIPEGDPGTRPSADYELVRVIVEPMPENRT